MAKRFGRNQRRKMKEQIKETETRARQIELRQSTEIVRLRQKLANSIQIDPVVLADHSRAAYEARLSAYEYGYDGHHVVQLIDERMMAMQRERDEFIKYVSVMMAKKLADGIGREWGRDRDPFADIIRA